jgi:hypothetical protein
MLWTALALGAAWLVPLVTRGSYARLLERPWRWGSFLVTGLGLQLVLDFLPFRHDQWHALGYGLLIASYVLVLGFVARNALFRGMSVVFIGVALNFVAILANGGMPVKIPPDWQGTNRVTTSVKHHPRGHDDHLIVITDIIVLRSPFNTVISFGDLIIAVGLCDVTYHASRPKRRRTGAARARKARPRGRVNVTRLPDVAPAGFSSGDLKVDASSDHPRERLDDEDVVHVVRAGT